MGCDLSNTINESAYKPGHQVIIHPQNSTGFHPQYTGQYPQPIQHQNPYQPYPNSHVQSFSQQQNPQQSKQVRSSPYQPEQKITQMTNTYQNEHEKNQNSEANLNNKYSSSQPPSKPRADHRRGIMPLRITYQDNFLTHHLKGEMHMCKYARADYIKKRQILEHQRFQQVVGRGCSTKYNHLNEFAIKSHYQRVMLDIFEKAHTEFFDDSKSYDDVRQKIAERYLFELFQNKEFLDASLGRYQSFFPVTQFSMSMTALASDSALFPILKFLKEKYPQVADKSAIQFPEVREKKKDINLMDNFPSKCYSSQGFVNVQTLFSDLKFLIDRSVEQFNDFQNDMKFILGDDVLTDSKVKRVIKNGNQEYSASPVRRVFIKWAETILQRIPEIVVSEAFLQFVRSKSIIADNFYFRSTVQPTTHGMVINFICELLQQAKYEITSLAKRKEFGFYIYDLLRCKTKRKTGEDVVELLNKMEGTKVTPSGKKFQVVRIKDRFKTPNRDLMVNFRYGDVIVGEAQLCIDTSDMSQKIKKTNKFNHYIYELERGLFGPTCELIMQYEDFERKDISANLQAEGPVKKRISKKALSYMKKTSIKCFNNHNMIQIEGNHFLKSEDGSYDEHQFFCDYCQAYFSSNNKYYYCYFCTLVICKGCQHQYQQLSPKKIQNRCNRQDMLIQLKTQHELQQIINLSPLVVFYLSKGEASTLYKDFLVYYRAINQLQNNTLPQIYVMCCDNPSTQILCKAYAIQEFPTTIVFSSDGTAQSTVVGASYEMIEGLIQVQQKLSKAQSKIVQMICFCGSTFEETQLDQNAQINCLGCGKTSLTDGLFGGLLESQRVFTCTTGHMRCQNCAFLVVQEPSKYRDYRGKSYLTDRKQQPQLPKCPSGHQMTFEKQLETSQMQCFKCQKQFLFMNIFGCGCCVTCNKHCCPSCIGINTQELVQSDVELVNHTIEATVEQGDKCLCRRSFKKVYCTRDYTRNLGENPIQGQDNQLLMMASVFENEEKTWKCSLCYQEKKDGELHLACFRCPYLSGHGTLANIEICIQCAIISDMLNKQLDPKITEIPTTFICKSKHPVVRTKLAYNNEETTLDCIGCRKHFYVHSERYYCKTCKTNVCLNCCTTQLTNEDPPKCVRKCTEDHALRLRVNPERLIFCDGCKVVIRKAHFSCVQNCGFDLCLNCAAASPDIDTRSRRLAEVDYEMVKKELQSYEKGWQEQFMDEAVAVAKNIESVAEKLEDVSNAFQQAANFFDF